MTQAVASPSAYRVTFILDTRGYEQPVENLVASLETTLKAIGGQVLKTNNLGRKDFIRLPNKKHAGDFYVQMEFAAGPTAPRALHEKLALEKTVKRVFVEKI